MNHTKSFSKRLLAVMLSLAMVFSLVQGVSLTASAETSGNYEYLVLDDGTIAISHYNGFETELTIPSELDGKTVTSIGNWAFGQCYSLKSVQIPDSVESIGVHAFGDCISLETVTIGNGVKSIAENAFSNTGLYNDEENWENGLLYIGKYLIAADYNISDNVQIKTGTILIADSAFRSCMLTSVQIPDSVKIIGEFAFSDSALTSIKIPDSVKLIGKRAFYSCASLKTVTIGNGVESICELAFYWCHNLTSIDVSTDNKNYSDIDGVLLNKDQSELIQYPIGITDDSYTIPNTVKIIGDDAFNGSENLLSINIGNSVESIGSWAFGCCQLTSIKISDSVKSIGSHAFSSCTKLKSIEIPGNVKSIGDDAFSYCASLTNVIIENGVESIDDWAFSYCYSLRDIKIPNSVESIGNNAFHYCSLLKNIDIADDNANYSDIDGVFFNKDHTILIQYPSGRTDTSYTIPDSVTSIGMYAFYRCTKLTNVKIGNSVESIGYGAFNSCTSLTNIVIPNNVTSIGDDVFYYCTSLTSVTIETGVKSIGDYAFDRCPLLVVNYAGTKEQWNKITGHSNISPTHYGVSISGDYVYKPLDDGTVEITSYIGSANELAIPSELDGKTVTSIGKYACYNCQSLTSVEIPNSVKSIGDDAFYSCTSLTDIVIPDSVESIGEYAFYNCTKLTSVTIGNSVESIDDYAFNYCTKLASVTYIGTEEQWNNITIGTYNDALKNATITFCQHTNKVTDNAVDSTCEDTGLTEGSHCAACGTVTIEQEVIPAKGHDTTLVPEKEATCTEDGTEAYYTCSGCGKWFSDAEAKEEITDESAVVKPALEHSFTNYVSDNNATCTEDGTKTATCDNNCDETDTVADKDSAKGHTIVTDKAVSATCVKAGKTEGSHCSVCNTVIEKQTKIKALGHSTTVKNKKSATYFAKGYSGDTVCTVCNKVITTGTAIAKKTLKTPTVTVTAGKKLFKVKYTKVKGATGFQVQYKKGKTTVTKTFSTNKTVTKAIKKLAKGTYKVKVRAMVKSGKKKAYSAWTKTKTIKI